MKRRYYHLRTPDMFARPRALAERMSVTPPPTTFTLPIEAARAKAREILEQFPKSGYMAIVENWRQLPDGRIEFTMRHLPAADEVRRKRNDEEELMCLGDGGELPFPAWGRKRKD